LLGEDGYWDKKERKRRLYLYTTLPKGGRPSREKKEPLQTRKVRRGNFFWVERGKKPRAGKGDTIGQCKRGDKERKAF